VTLFKVVVERWVVSADLVDGFAGRVLAVRACILVFLEVFDVRLFPNVFAALESGFLPADTLFGGSCGGWAEGGCFVVTREVWIRGVIVDQQGELAPFHA
jgi:hypothetical protein